MHPLPVHSIAYSETVSSWDVGSFFWHAWIDLCLRITASSSPSPLILRGYFFLLPSHPSFPVLLSPYLPVSTTTLLILLILIIPPTLIISLFFSLFLHPSHPSFLLILFILPFCLMLLSLFPHHFLILLIYRQFLPPLYSLHSFHPFHPSHCCLFSSYSPFSTFASFSFLIFVILIFLSPFHCLLPDFSQSSHPN